MNRTTATTTDDILFSYTVVDKYLFYKILSDSINEGVFIKIDVFRFYLWIKFKICLQNCIYMQFSLLLFFFSRHSFSLSFPNIYIFRFHTHHVLVADSKNIQNLTLACKLFKIFGFVFRKMVDLYIIRFNQFRL